MADVFDKLTRRERHIMQFLAIGATNGEIAQALRLSEGTIRNAIARITIKLGVVDRTQAALLAYHSGLDLEDTLRTPGTPPE